jgi:hypothetical protein
MLSSTVSTLHDNSTHGEDTFLVRDLGDRDFLDVVLDGVTGHGGAEASQSVYEALNAAQITSVEDVVAAVADQNEEFFQVGGGRFLLTTISVALYLNGRLFFPQRRRQPDLPHTFRILPAAWRPRRWSTPRRIHLCRWRKPRV